MSLARPSARGQFLFMVVAYGCLTAAFINNDFSVLLAANHSNSTLPLIYRIHGRMGQTTRAHPAVVADPSGWDIRRVDLLEATRRPHRGTVLGVMA